VRVLAIAGVDFYWGAKRGEEEIPSNLNALGLPREKEVGMIFQPLFVFHKWKSNDNEIIDSNLRGSRVVP
jgi:hypothetical protein